MIAKIPFLRMVLAGYVWLIPIIAPIPPIMAVPPADSSWLHVWIVNGISDYQLLHNKYLENRVILTRQLEILDRRLQSDEPVSCEEGYQILYKKLQLEQDLRTLEEEAEWKVVRMRFRKSIEILKMLYEKILSMDHHFSSLKAHQQVMRISNPHEYPDFKEVKTVLEERMKKKLGFALPPFMESNPYLSAVFSIIGLTLGNESRLNREQLDRIGCILDFTVQMHDDLSLIYFEACYLHDANLSIKQECETLFADCTRPLGYNLSMSACRDSDDWERLYHLLEQQALQPQSGTVSQLSQQQIHINLLFSIDRVVRFIDRYGAYVAQCKEYYKKFARIADSYDNKQVCAVALPAAYEQIKKDIQTTLDKFNNAYNIPEIQGSRLKDLLYGQVEQSW